jgi:cell division septal protein FtsQ
MEVQMIDDLEHFDELANSEDITVNEAATKQAAKIARRYKLGLFLLGIITIVCAIWYTQREIIIDELEIVGNELTVDAEIVNIANSALGTKADSLNIVGLIEQIQQLDYIKEASLYVEPSGSLRIYVEERQPIAWLVDGSIYAMVDKEGVIMPTTTKFLDIPLLHGFTAKNHSKGQLSKKEFEQLGAFLTVLKSDAFSNATISEVVFNNERGVTALSNDNGVKISFGKDNFESKLANWKLFHSQIVKYKGINAFSEVDLRFTNQIITREV